jgi:hypothetical protein
MGGIRQLSPIRHYRLRLILLILVMDVEERLHVSRLSGLEISLTVSQ